MPYTEDTTLKVIIIDDERDACYSIKDAINHVPGINTHIYGIAQNTWQGEGLIHAYKPDVVFLDIEMPNENAFSFLDRIAPIHFEVVFVTAYDEFAVKAFKLNALDYILKPINTDEITTSLYRLREKILFRHYMESMGNNEPQKQVYGTLPDDKIVLKENNERMVIRFSDILFIEAQGSYSKIFFTDGRSIKEKIASSNIAEYEQLFPDDSFYRVHKSYLVNCRHIHKIIKKDGFNIKCSFLVLACGYESVKFLCKNIWE